MGSFCFWGLTTIYLLPILLVTDAKGKDSIDIANGTQKPGSDIDVVIDGDSMRVDIMEYIKSQFQNEVDVLWVERKRNKF